MDHTLDQIIQLAPVITEKRNYWFVRTNGGRYYEEFIKNGFIAINYNEISLEDIQVVLSDKDENLTPLVERIKTVYEGKESWPTHAASQLFKFTYKIKRGDIVFIPSKGSEEFCFGEVTETPAFLGEPKHEDICRYLKRKRVKWLKRVSRYGMDPNLYRLMFSHHAITEADEYSRFIDMITNSFYIKKDTAFMVLHVHESGDLNARVLFEIGMIAFDLLDEFCSQEDLPFRSKDFKIKLNLQSPGPIEFSGIVAGIAFLGLLLVAISGGDFMLKTKTHLDVKFKSDGLIKRLMDFIINKKKSDTREQILKRHMDDFKLETPDDLVKILKELDKK